MTPNVTDIKIITHPGRAQACTLWTKTRTSSMWYTEFFCRTKVDGIAWARKLYPMAHLILEDTL